MSEYPEDIMKTAKEAWSAIPLLTYASAVDAIAAAILAERNRCAVTARETYLYDGDVLKNSDPRLTVAQAIMKGGAA